MKTIVSIILGFISAGVSYFLAVFRISGFAADEVYRGFPFPFYHKVIWPAFLDDKSGPFSIVTLVVDITIWAALWFAVISILIRIIKDKKNVEV